MIYNFQFKQMELDDLRVMLNADFSDLDVDELMTAVDSSFGELINNTDVMGTLKNLDMDFQYAFDQYEHSMTEFIQSNRWKNSFYVYVSGADLRC